MRQTFGCGEAFECGEAGSMSTLSIRKGKKMTRDNVLEILTADDIVTLLDQGETETMAIIEEAYRAHARGDTNCPHSLFLRLPGTNSRIIALPAYIDDETEMAGLKWISSFPSNLGQGLPRASALIVLNSMETGRAYAVMEGSIISAKRTAASVAVAAAQLTADRGSVTSVGVIGCGEINREVLGFLARIFPQLGRVRIFDTNPGRAEAFARFCEKRFSVKTRLERSIDEVLAGGQVISIATTAATPHIQTLSMCPSSTLILHLSLRDIAPEALLAVDNVVDDIDHVCRENTSLDLAAKASGHRQFIRTTIGKILTGVADAGIGSGRITVFSPFGLGILDLALAAHVYKAARNANRTQIVQGFHAAASLALNDAELVSQSSSSLR
jgi:N-[(2S)-2-amino-2-carboxyethyl]-L-glutamate dehydrogenase